MKKVIVYEYNINIIEKPAFKGTISQIQGKILI